MRVRSRGRIFLTVVALAITATGALLGAPKAVRGSPPTRPASGQRLEKHSSAIPITIYADGHQVRLQSHTETIGTRVIIPGQPGQRQVALRQVLVDGEPRSVLPVAEVILAQPVNQVVAVGVDPPVARDGGTHRRDLPMHATGYAVGDGNTPGDLTYTGVPARRGVAAVDPTVIPLGTPLYVEGYGPAMAADTGSAIRGMRIDLAFDTVGEAVQWGVREVVVSILNDPHE